jgi:hypothetical protein
MVQATSPQSVDHLSSVYEQVDDVDLFTGDVKLFVPGAQPNLYVCAGNTKGGRIIECKIVASIPHYSETHCDTE